MIKEIFYIFSVTVVVVCCLIAAIKDIKTRKIPNNIILALIVYWVIFSFVDMLFIKLGIIVCDIEDELYNILINLLSAFFIACILFIIEFLLKKFRNKKSQLGAGDIKLISVICLFFGYYRTIIIILLSCIFFIAYVLGKKIIKKQNVSQLPFAPFIFLGLIIVVILTYTFPEIMLI